MLFYNSGALYVYVRDDGALSATIPLTGYAGFANVNVYSVVYTGQTNYEIGLLDYVNRRILLFDRFSGVFAGLTQLPASAVVHNQFRFCYTNDRVLLFNSPAKTWNAYCIWNEGCALGILPVEFIRQRAACDKGTPLLTWATGSESSNAYFAIERSTDAETWERAGQLNSTGNSQQVTEYTWRDERPLFASVVYYRLRQVDLDGREEVLAVLPLASCTNGSTELSVMPNPTDGPIEVRWAALGKAGIAELRVVDMHGRTLRSERIQGDATRAEMDLTGIAAGTCTLLGLDAQGGAGGKRAGGAALATGLHACESQAFVGGGPCKQPGSWCKGSLQNHGKP